MKRFLTRIYITLKLIQIARQNKKRAKFYNKFDFGDCGENLENATLVWATVDNKGLKEKGKESYSTSNRLSTDDYGIKTYVHQTVGYSEDDFSGTIYRKTPIKGLFIRTWFNC